MREEMRAFGYLCPKCGKTVLKARSVFALEASGAEVECDCGGSALTVSFDGERYRLTVPCGLCGETHTAVCSPEQVLEKATALACAGTKQFCCFIGPEGTVEKQLRELAILAEKEKRQGENEAFLDNVIMYEVLSELRDIAARGGISCACGSRRSQVWADLHRASGYGQRRLRPHLPGLRGQTPGSRRHGPGPGRPVLSHETGAAGEEIRREERYQMPLLRISCNIW